MNDLTPPMVECLEMLEKGYFVGIYWQKGVANVRRTAYYHRLPGSDMPIADRDPAVKTVDALKARNLVEEWDQGAAITEKGLSTLKAIRDK